MALLSWSSVSLINLYIFFLFFLLSFYSVFFLLSKSFFFFFVFLHCGIHQWNLSVVCWVIKTFFNSTTAGLICLHAWLETHYYFFQLSSHSLWDSGPESRRSSWTSTSRAPSLHRRSQSGEMESLLSDTHSGSNPSSREHSLDQQEYLQVPVLHLPECNGTTFHLPEQCCEDAPLTAHYHSDQEDDETEEVSYLVFVAF